MNADPSAAGDGKPEKLEKVVTHLLEECRMLLPGIQAIFGFQLIAVFQNVYQSRLDAGQQEQHLLALVLVAVSMGLVLAPVAYHRQVEPQSISHHFVIYGSVLLTIALLLFMSAAALDAQIIARLSGLDPVPAWSLAGAILAFFTVMWFAVPWVVRWRAAVHRRQTTVYNRPT